MGEYADSVIQDLNAALSELEEYKRALSEAREMAQLYHGALLGENVSGDVLARHKSDAHVIAGWVSANE